MKLRLTVLLMAILSLASCKDDKKGADTKEAPAAVVDKENDIFKVSFDLILKKDDNLHLYYTEDGTINFNEKSSVWMPIIGSDKVQTITFKLPKDVLPTALRVDFGFEKNEAQSDVELKAFKMNYFGQEAVAEGTAIFDYFYPNKGNTEIVPGTSTLKRLKKDQPSGPTLYPQIPLSEKLKQMTVGK